MGANGVHTPPDEDDCPGNASLEKIEGSEPAVLDLGGVGMDLTFLTKKKRQSKQKGAQLLVFEEEAAKKTSIISTKTTKLTEDQIQQ
mmetsp:Transcript_4179/g.6279  ORF Transcript_4179/g.6279 Transcript_4179/m.6279 type:complete len:87 (+) Transcript_4179:308-568(+)